MTEVPDREPRQANLATFIRDRIMQRTGGRIQHLEIEVADDQIEVRGRTSSFHLKQLAIQGIMDEVGARGKAQRREIAVRIDVLPPQFKAPIWAGS